MKHLQSLLRLRDLLHHIRIHTAVRLSPCKTWGKSIGFSALYVFNTACTIHLFTEYVGRPSMMSGPSMLPTLANEGELVIEDRLTYRLFPERLRRGDLITLYSPLEPGRLICKRVIGMPGDIICVDPTGVLAPSLEHVTIPKGHIWISGDNAAHSRDSREYGPVPISLVYGRLLAKVWPPRDATIFRSPITFID